jgi:hypothetical protein
MTQRRSVCFVGCVKSRHCISASLRSNTPISDRLKKGKSRLKASFPLLCFFGHSGVAKKRDKRDHASLEAKPDGVPPGNQVWHALLADLFDGLRGYETAFTDCNFLFRAKAGPWGAAKRCCEECWTMKYDANVLETPLHDQSNAAKEFWAWLLWVRQNGW